MDEFPDTDDLINKKIKETTSKWYNPTEVKKVLCSIHWQKNEKKNKIKAKM